MPLAQGAQRPRADPRPWPDMRWTWAGLAQAGCRHAPHLRGGEAVGGLERAAERALAFETEFLGDRANGQSAVAHQRPGARKAQACDVLARGLAEDVAVHADQVPGRVVRALGQLGQVEVAVVAALDQLMHAQQALQGQYASLQCAAVAAFDQQLQVRWWSDRAGAEFARANTESAAGARSPCYRARRTSRRRNSRGQCHCRT